MSNAARLAEILKKLGDAHYQAADDLLALAGDQVVAPKPVAAEPLIEEGHERVCPIHRAPMTPKPWNPNLYGCNKKGSDPAWTNPKGYCTITTENVADYLRMRAAV